MREGRSRGGLMANGHQLGFLCLSMAVVATIVACSAPGASPAEKAAVPAAKSAPTAAPAAPARANWPKSVSIAGGPLGSTHYASGVALSKVLEQHLGVTAAVETTGGPAQNIQLLHSNQVQFGPFAVVQGVEAMTGADGGPKRDRIRVMFPLSSGVLHWWAPEDRKIKSIRDFNGKVIHLSGKGSAPDVFGRRLFELLDIKPANIVNIPSFEQAHSLMKDGKIDAVGTFGGAPHVAAREFVLTRPSTIIGVDEGDAKKFIEKYSGFAVGTVPAGTYKAQDKPVTSLFLWQAWSTNADMPEDFIYETTKAVFANKETFIQATAVAQELQEGNVQQLTMAMHPGAYRFYLEKGIKVADSAKP